MDLSRNAAAGRPARSNLAVRLLTAGVAAPLILLDIYLGPVGSFYAVVLCVTALAGWEFFQMTHRDDLVARSVGTALCCLVSWILWRYGDDSRALVTMLVLLPFAAIVLALVRLGAIETAAARMSATVFGPIWIGMLTCLALLRRDLGRDGAGFVVLTLMYAWFADTGGYFAGRFFGRRKLYEAVSPKKTIEGLFGGLGGAALGATLAHFWYLPRLALAEGVGLGLLLGALGQAGDLGESLLKRSVGVKDSGEIVPGHGGILDRVDALFVTSALVYVYTRWR